MNEYKILTIPEVVGMYILTIENELRNKLQ
jgi:hypothetical protein